MFILCQNWAVIELSTQTTLAKMAMSKSANAYNRVHWEESVSEKISCFFWMLPRINSPNFVTNIISLSIKYNYFIIQF